MLGSKGKIFLIGYRATGKSCVGTALATRLGLPFLDMDKEIEKRAGRPISALVADAGWEGFRRRERELLQELADSDEAMVIATGGGAVLHQELWPRLKAKHLVAWLTADIATIGARLAADPATATQRPSLTGQEVLAEIAAVLAEREPLYRQSAHCIVDTTSTPLATVVEQLVALVRNPTAR